MKFRTSRFRVLVAVAAIALLALPAARDITAQSQSTLTVDVVKDGEAQENFQVQLLGIPAAGVDAAPGVVATLATDAAGQISFTGLAAGQYQAVGVEGQVPDSCHVIPAPIVNLDGTAPGASTIRIECGDSGLWQLLLLAPLGITSSDPPTLTPDPAPEPDTP